METIIIFLILGENIKVIGVSLVKKTKKKQVVYFLKFKEVKCIAFHFSVALGHYLCMGKIPIRW